jgi:hypothetical protein
MTGKDGKKNVACNKEIISVIHVHSIWKNVKVMGIFKWDLRATEQIGFKKKKC